MNTTTRVTSIANLLNNYQDQKNPALIVECCNCLVKKSDFGVGGRAHPITDIETTIIAECIAEYICTPFGEDNVYREVYLPGRTLAPGVEYRIEIDEFAKIYAASVALSIASERASKLGITSSPPLYGSSDCCDFLMAYLAAILFHYKHCVSSERNVFHVFHILCFSEVAANVFKENNCASLLSEPIEMYLIRMLSRHDPPWLRGFTADSTFQTK